MGSGEARAPSVLGSISAPGWPGAAVMAGTIHSWASSNTSSRLPWTPFPVTPAGPLPQPLGSTVNNIQQLVKVYTLNKDQQWDNQNARHVIQLRGAAEGHVLASQGLTKCGPLEKGMANHFSILVLRTPWTVWKGKKIQHWEMSTPGQEVSNILLGKSGGQLLISRMKRMSQSGNDAQLWMLSGREGKVQWNKEQYCLGTWNVRFINQGKLDVVKQEIARLSTDILEIRELKWIRMGEFNSGDHSI